MIASPLTGNKDVLDYQVRQTEHGVAIDAVSATTVDTSALSAEVRAGLTEVGLTDPTVEIRVVPNLTRDSETGKLAQFVPTPRERTALHAR